MTVSNRTLGGRGQNGASGNLALATIAFAVNFWAWNLISPLASSYSDQMSLSSAKTSVLVAMPVLVGSVGRIPVGALTDRYGGRTMFTLLSLITIAPVLAVAVGRKRRVIPAAAALRTLSRHRRHDVRGGHPVRQCLARAEPTWFRDRRLRGGDGRHRAVRILHAAFRVLVRQHDNPRDHRRGAARHCRDGQDDDAGRAGLGAEHVPGAAEAERGGAGSPSPGRCRSSTRSRSAASWPSPPTCRPT